MNLDSPLVINLALTGMVPRRKDNPHTPISPDEIAADDLVVDLRGPDEAPQPFAGGRRMPVDHVAALAAEPQPAGRIVLCCRSGQRALMAADALRERGVARLALVALG